MVAVRDKHGNVLFNEPPYSEVEQADLYKRMDGVAAFTRPDPKADVPPKPSRPEEPQQ